MKILKNVNKTKAKIISNENFDKNNVNIVINNTKVDIEHEIKYLGTIIDDKSLYEKLLLD